MRESAVMLEKEKKVYKESNRNGVIFVFVRDNKILVEERKKPDNFFGYTIIPGGHIEEGESPRDALKREVQEELGVLVDSSDQLGAIETNVYRAVFFVREWKGEIIDQEPDKSNIKFVTMKEAREICDHPITQKILDMVEPYLRAE